MERRRGAERAKMAELIIGESLSVNRVGTSSYYEMKFPLRREINPTRESEEAGGELSE